MSIQSHVWSVKTVSHLHKPRYVLVGFQHNRKNMKTKDVSKFDSLQMRSLKLYLNSHMYPYHMHDISVPTESLPSYIMIISIFKHPIIMEATTRIRLA